jgi:predicted MPP superfamily phosphohydrolase
MSNPAPTNRIPGFSRRKFLSCAGFGGLVGLACASDASLVEPYQLEIGRHQFTTRSPQPGNELKLLHLSDFHASWAVSLEFIEQAIDLGLSLKPDLICLTGDYITQRWDDYDAYARVLSKLSAAAPVFACLGNHDGGNWAGLHGGYPTSYIVSQFLRQCRVNLLSNGWTSLRLKDRELTLVGLRDEWSEPGDLAASFPRPEPSRDEIRLVLAHNPDTKKKIQSHPWDLMLCGHTHGGQVVLPLLGGGMFAPVHDKHYLAGLLPWDNRWIHITRGVGNVHGLRFNCPPEVSLLTLV